MRRARLHDDDVLVVAICLAVAVGVLIGAVTALWIMSGVPEKAFPRVP